MNTIINIARASYTYKDPPNYINISGEAVRDYHLRSMDQCKDQDQQKNQLKGDQGTRTLFISRLSLEKVTNHIKRYQKRARKGTCRQVFIGFRIVIVSILTNKRYEIG